MASSASVCVSVAIIAHAHQLLDDLGGGDVQVLGDLADGRAGVDLDDVRWSGGSR